MKTLLKIAIIMMAIVGLVGAADMKNTVTATGTDNEGVVVTATDEAIVAVEEVTKVGFFKDTDIKVAKPGDKIEYTYRVSNEGTSKISNLRIADDTLGTITPAATTLLPGEFTTGHATQTITEAMLPGPVINYALLTADTSLGEKLELNASTSVELEAKSDIAVRKLVEAGPVKVGADVVYAFEVTNIGSRTLKNVTAKDDRLGPITLAKTTLAPGETTKGSITHRVVAEDIV